MLFPSPFPTLVLPPEETTLPHFLLDVSDPRRTAEPLLYPPPPASPFHAGRPLASALSLDGLRKKAYQTGKSILLGAMDSQTAPFQKGDVVAIYSPNQHDYLAIVLGIHLVGGVAALCNPSYKAAELAHQLRMTRSRCIITTAAPAAKPGESTLDKAREALRLACSNDDDDAAGGFAKLPYSPALFVFEEGEQDSWDAICQKVQVTEAIRTEVNERSRQVHGSDAAVLCFSSGTSGLPKAVILTHSNLVANTIQASFLLHDRMNEPLVDGKKYSQDGNRGWYDEAQKSGAGRQVEPDGAVNEQATTEAASTGEKTSGETTTKVKATMGAKLQKMATARLPSFFLRGGDTSKGQKRIASRQAGRQEFHIDVLPQFHCYGLLVNLVALHTCTPRIVLPRFHLETYLQSISDHGVTFSFVVPPILLALAKHPLVARYDVSTLWRVASGAASLPEEIAVAIGKRLRIRCTDGYGMTEMSPIISMQTVTDIEKAPNTVGALAPNTDALVLDSEGRELGPGEPGELLLRGPQMMKGYLENDEANARAFYRRQEDDTKWLRTGDVARIDERGYITITDRLKDVIKAKGFQVSPAELEAILFKDARVADVAVTGVRGESDGAEKPWAFIVPHESAFADEKDGQTAKDDVAKSILERANSQMAGYKRVEGVTWLDALPKSDAGKVLKKDLVARK